LLHHKSSQGKDTAKPYYMYSHNACSTRSCGCSTCALTAPAAHAAAAAAHAPSQRLQHTQLRRGGAAHGATPPSECPLPTGAAAGGGQVRSLACTWQQGDDHHHHEWMGSCIMSHREIHDNHATIARRDR